MKYKVLLLLACTSLIAEDTKQNEINQALTEEMEHQLLDEMTEITASYIVEVAQSDASPGDIHYSILEIVNLFLVLSEARPNEEDLYQEQRLKIKTALVKSAKHLQTHESAEYRNVGDLFMIYSADIV